MGIAAALLVAAQPPAVSPPPREVAKPAPAKLADGSTLWPATPSEGERIWLSSIEHQKLLDQIEQLQKQLAARKGVPPSSCAIRAKIEKRGEVSIAALKLTYSFRTTAANTAVSLGAKRSFLAVATLDGVALPVLETTDDGFAVLIDSAGSHTVVLDVECPITTRGGKPEIGFELGLPRAAITTLIFEPTPGLARVSLTTRTVDPGAVKPPEPRRIAGLDVKALAAPAAGRDPYPLGPIDSLELSWEPVAAAPNPDVVQSAEADVVTAITESLVETTAKYKLRGPSRSWRIAAPVDAVVSVDRAAPATAPEGGEQPAIGKPADAMKPVWTINLPAGTSGTDWIVTVFIRKERPKDGGARGPFAIGPLAVLDVSRQSGTIKISAATNVRLAVKHGPELRQESAPGLPSEDESAVYFRLASGASGSLPPAAPLYTVEAIPLTGRVAVRPTYKLNLTEAGWTVRAELRITPIRRSVTELTIELPAEWRAPEVSPPEVVDSATPQKSEGPRQTLVIRLAAEHRQPFDLILTASIPTSGSAKEAAILLPRFPGAAERDTSVQVTVPEGLEVRGSAREWEGDQPASFGAALSPLGETKSSRAVTVVGGKSERGMARLDLAWNVYRPPLAADIRADLVVHESQIVVTERVTLKSPEGLPRTVRFQGAADLPGLTPFERTAPGQWLHNFSGDLREATLKFEYVVPLPAKTETGARRTPVSLVLPAGTGRCDVLARVWVSTGTGRTVRVDAGPWRELAPDPAAERDALPALTLAGAGSELPLTLDIADAGETGAAQVWIERGLIQATAADDGAAIRARFLLRRWFTDSLEVRLPDALGNSVPEVYLDDPPKRLPIGVQVNGAGERVLRVPLPEAKPGRTLVLEIRYQLPPAPRDEPLAYAAPRPVAAFAGPVRWQITGPAGTVPLLLQGSRAEQRWRLRTGMLLPLSASAEELDRWFASGLAEDTGSGSADAAVIRLTAPDLLTVLHVSRLNLAVACSVGVLLLGLVLSRLPGGIAGPIVALFGGAIAVAAILYPQPATQIAACALPGLIALAAVLTVQAFARWYYRRRITYLPGFARSQPSPPTASGSRPSDLAPAPLGSTGSARGTAPQPASTGS
jgi:hypothetical protein